MKILRIFGVVVGVHVFAMMLIFVNPGCSSTNKPAPPSAEETVVKDNGETPTISTASGPESSAAPAISYAPATDAGGSPVVRFSPTRPGTPAAGALEAAPVTDVVPASTYTVVSGDSLWTIARKHHLTVAELAAANNIKSTSVVRLGQKLIIPAKAVAGSSVSVADPNAAKSTPPTTAPRANGETVRHVVKPGETLGAIARKYQVRVGEIATANNISDPAKIRPGMELTIPGWQAPAGKSAKASASSSLPSATEAPPAATHSATEVPTLVIPPPDGASGQPASGSAEPPVIRVDDQK